VSELYRDRADTASSAEDQDGWAATRRVWSNSVIAGDGARDQHLTTRSCVSQRG
jgi:hypothetical protein